MVSAPLHNNPSVMNTSLCQEASIQTNLPSNQRNEAIERGVGAGGDHVKEGSSPHRDLGGTCSVTSRTKDRGRLVCQHCSDGDWGPKQT